MCLVINRSKLHLCGRSVSGFVKRISNMLVVDTFIVVLGVGTAPCIDLGPTYLVELFINYLLL